VNAEQLREASDATPLRSKWRRLLIVGIVLSLGPILGVLGMAIAMGASFRRIETSPAPTPGELSVGVWWIPGVAALGMLAGIAGAGLVLWSYKKLRALEPEPDLLDPKSGPWT
jgi:hypothetical protein